MPNDLHLCKEHAEFFLGFFFLAHLWFTLQFYNIDRCGHIFFLFETAEKTFEGLLFGERCWPCLIKSRHSGHSACDPSSIHPCLQCMSNTAVTTYSANVLPDGNSDKLCCYNAQSNS